MAVIPSRVNISVKSFSPLGEGVSEYHFLITVSDPMLPFTEQLDAVVKAAQECADGKTALFRRFFLSDPSNQTEPLLKALEGGAACPTSIIGQPPLDGTKLAAWVYAAGSDGAPVTEDCRPSPGVNETKPEEPGDGFGP